MVNFAWSKSRVVDGSFGNVKFGFLTVIKGRGLQLIHKGYNCVSKQRGVNIGNSDDTHPNVVSDNPIHSLNFDIDIFSCLSLGNRLEQQPDWKSRHPPIPSTHVPSENWSVKLRAEIHRHKSIQKSWPEPGGGEASR